MAGNQYRRTPLAVLAVVFLVSCASIAKVNREVDVLLEAGHYEEAAVYLEQSRGVYGERNALLYCLERAFVDHLAENYEASNLAFECAKERAAAAYSESLSQGGLSWIVNDGAIEYAGANFERAMIHIFAGLNYAQMGQRQAALVEMRQLDHLLATFRTNHGDDYTYRQDAFGRYFSGMLYEDDGDIDDAYIAYQSALREYAYYGEAYGVGMPFSLRRSGAMAAARMGFGAQRAFAAEFGTVQGLDTSGSVPVSSDGGAAAGKLVVFHYNGRSPKKIERNITMSFGKGWAYVNASTSEGIPEEDYETAVAVAASIPASDTIYISLPEYVEQEYGVRHMRASVGGMRLGSPELVQDLGAIAIKDLEDRIWAIRAKAIARAAIKYAMRKSVASAMEGSDDPNVRAAAGIADALLAAYQVLSERADTRSWRSIPDQIWMTEGELRVGDHAYELTFVDASGNEVERKTGVVAVRPGQRTFLLTRTMR